MFCFFLAHRLAAQEKAIELVANSEIAGLDTYMSDRKAMQYEVFRVTKIKKGFRLDFSALFAPVAADGFSWQLEQAAGAAAGHR